MSWGSTVQRFRVHLSDMERGVFEELAWSIVPHPSETPERFVVRMLAYALSWSAELELSKGVCDGDEPALSVPSDHGRRELWIDIGEPAPKRLSKAMHHADRVLVFAAGSFDALRLRCQGKRVHRADEIELYSLDPALVADLAERLERKNEWTVTLSDGQLYVHAGDLHREVSFGVERLDSAKV